MSKVFKIPYVIHVGSLEIDINAQKCEIYLV